MRPTTFGVVAVWIYSPCLLANSNVLMSLTLKSPRDGFCEAMAVHISYIAVLSNEVALLASAYYNDIAEKLVVALGVQLQA